jgi:DnaD/phage-associated family protein
MNYIKEMNAFKTWLSYNKLSSGAIALWYTLLSLNNGIGWKKQFSVPNHIVEQYAGLSKKGLIQARKQLVDQGLIKYIPGHKRTAAPKYELISLADQFNFSSSAQNENSAPREDTQTSHTHEPKTAPNSDTNIGTNTDTHTTPLYKQKENINKNKTNIHHPKAVLFYEENFGQLSPYARESLLEWCKKMGEEMVIAAMQIAIKSGGQTFAYIERILQEWSRAKLETVEQIEAYQKRKASYAAKRFPRKGSLEQKQELLDKFRKGE